MNYSFMIEADYPPGTIIILNNEDPPYAPIRHKIHRVTHIVPTEPFLDKEVIAIDLSHVPEYAEQMQEFIVEMHRGIQEKRVAAWNEQERLRAAADHVPVARGGSPGFRPFRRTPQGSVPVPMNDNDIPLGRVFVPQGGRKSRRGRKNKKSKKRRSMKRRSNRRRRR